MNKRKVIKRIAAWLMCLAMVMTTINLPAFTTEVKAEEAEEGSVTFWSCECVFYPGTSGKRCDYCVKGQHDNCRFRGLGDTYCYEDTRSWSDIYWECNITDTSIGRKAFGYADPYLTPKSIIIPNGITNIEDEAFQGCELLESIIIPNSVTSIGDSAFSDCHLLTSVTIPNGVTTIGSQTFFCCDSLTSITIPNSVTSIGKNVFGECISIENITAPCTLASSVDSWKGYACYATVTYTHKYTFIDSDTHKCLADGCDAEEAHSFTDGICVCGYKETCVQGNHNFSVSVNETTHKCADCDATENHVFSNDSDTTCDVCGYERTVTEEDPTSEEIIYEVDINGIHHVKYDEEAEMYICQDKDCGEQIEPGYYLDDIRLEDEIGEMARYALKANQTEGDIPDYSRSSVLEIADFRNLTNTGCIIFRENESLHTLNLKKLTSASQIEFDDCAVKTLDLGNLISVERDILVDSCASLTNLNLGNLTELTEESGVYIYCNGALEIVDIGNLANASVVFDYCNSIRTLIIHRDDPCHIIEHFDFEEVQVAYVPHTYIVDMFDSNQHICTICDATGDHIFSDETCQGVCADCGVKNVAGNHNFSVSVNGTTHQCANCAATGNHDFSQNGTCACGLIQIEFEIIDDDEKTVRVTGLNKDFDMTHDLFIPSTVEVNEEDYSVTEIGVQAFRECNITGEVVIPDSVITISNDAFSGFGNIERISIPCTIDPYETNWDIDYEKIVQR